MMKRKLLSLLLVLCLCLEKELDLLLLGQDVAAQSGMNVRAMQLALILISVVLRFGFTLLLVPPMANENEHTLRDTLKGLMGGGV